MTDSAKCDADEIAGRILKVCVLRGLSIVAAESLTGGLLADAFVRVPGASAVFLGSVVTYDIRAKASVLGVDAELLRTEGAVHPEVARQMATGVATLYSGVEDLHHMIALSTTGVAGPGPDGSHPAGEVYIAVSIPEDAFDEKSTRSDGVHVQHLQLSGSRQQVREQSVEKLLQSLAALIGA